MKNYFLIYLPILLSYNIIAMNNTGTSNYKSSLSYILNNNFIDDIKKHLENGGNINAFNCNGETLLILAIKKNDLEAVKFLLDNNALVFLPVYNSPNSGIKNTLDYIKENTNPQIIELVKQKYNQELDTLKLNFLHFFENNNTLNNNNNNVNNLTNTNNNNLNNSNTIDNNLFNNISNLSNNQPSELFNNLQNIESQTNNHNIELVNTQNNTTHTNTALVNQEQNNTTNAENNLNNKWQCEICSKFFAYKNNLNKHKKVVHAI